MVKKINGSGQKSGTAGTQFPKSLRKKKPQKIEKLSTEHIPSEMQPVEKIGTDVKNNIMSFLKPEDCPQLRWVSPALRESGDVDFIKKLRPHFFKEIVTQYGWEVEKWPSGVGGAIERHREKITKLNLKGIDVSKGNVQQLYRLFPNLQTLSLEQVQFEDDAAVHELSCFTHLEVLSLAGSTAAVLPSLEGVPLRHLDIHGCDKLTNRTIQSLPYIPTLKILDASNTDLSSFEFLNQNLQVEELYISQCQRIKSGAFQFFPQGTQIRTLQAKHVDIKSLEFLTRLEHIESLSLESCFSLSTEELYNFPRLPTLRDIDLSSTHLDSFKVFERNGQLEKVNVSQCFGLGEMQNMDHFPRMPCLQSLNVSRVRLHSFMLLGSTPQLREFNCINCNVPHDVLFPVVDHLRKLHIGNLPGFWTLGSIGRCSELEELELFNFTPLQLRSFESLTSLKNIKSLKIHSPRLTVKIFKTLHLDPIEKLDVAGCGHLDLDKMPYIPKLKHLKVDVSHGMASFLSKQKDLESLEIAGNVSLEHTRFLVDLPKLKKLFIRCDLTQMPTIRSDNVIEDLRIEQPQFDVAQFHAKVRKEIPRLESLRLPAVAEIRGVRSRGVRKIDTVEKQMTIAQKVTLVAVGILFSLFVFSSFLSYALIGAVAGVALALFAYAAFLSQKERPHLRGRVLQSS